MAADYGLLCESSGRAPRYNAWHGRAGRASQILPASLAQRLRGLVPAHRGFAAVCRVSSSPDPPPASFRFPVWGSGIGFGRKQVAV
jgi:hypothetical protein